MLSCNNLFACQRLIQLGCISLAVGCLLIQSNGALAQDPLLTSLSIWDEPQLSQQQFPQRYPQQQQDRPLAEADPNAPKGGKVRFGAIGSYDSFNPFSPSGLSAARLSMTYETLCEQMKGEEYIARGLLAESFELPADRSYLIVHLRPQARFHDGQPVTAQDVEFTFNALVTQASPMYKSYYTQVSGIEVIDPLTVRFNFAESDNRELPMIVCQLPVLSKQWWQGRDIGSPLKEPPLGSGPYKVKDAKVGTTLIFERDPNWWGKDLPINLGRHNFDIIQVDYYRDIAISREAFFAGELDFFTETTIKDWINSYNVPPVKNGSIVKVAIPQSTASGISGFFLNSRNPILADRHVRQALILLFDFEWTNQALFYGEYSRYTSFFTNSHFAAPALPDTDELAVLEPYRSQLPPEVFSALPDLPQTDGSGNIRLNQRKALELLKQSGWSLKEGVLRNDKGEQLKLTFLLSSPTMQRVIMPYKKNLEQVGIQLNVQLVDQTQYIARVRSFDYDIMLATLRQSGNPGNEQRNYWSSAAAQTHGSRNYLGLTDPVIDSLIEKLIASSSKQELITHTRALDRLLRHGAYVVPGWYSKDIRLAWWKDRITPPTTNGSDHSTNITTWHMSVSQPAGEVR